MNELENFFFNQHHRLIHKWNHYFEIYERHLKHLKDTKINLLEIGISHGGSLQMWDHYFNGNAMIYAVDINPECKKFESANTSIFIGSQENKNFLYGLRSLVPPVDVLIDDAVERVLVVFATLPGDREILGRAVAALSAAGAAAGTACIV